MTTLHAIALGIALLMLAQWLETRSVRRLLAHAAQRSEEHDRVVAAETSGALVAEARFQAQWLAELGHTREALAQLVSILAELSPHQRPTSPAPPPEECAAHGTSQPPIPKAPRFDAPPLESARVCIPPPPAFGSTREPTPEAPADSSRTLLSFQMPPPAARSNGTR